VIDPEFAVRAMADLLNRIAELRQQYRDIDSAREREKLYGDVLRHEESLRKQLDDYRLSLMTGQRLDEEFGLAKQELRVRDLELQASYNDRLRDLALRDQMARAQIANDTAGMIATAFEISIQRMSNTARLAQDLADNVTGSISSAFSSLVTSVGQGSDAIKKIFSGLLGNLAKAFADFAAQQAVKAMFSLIAKAAGGIGGGWGGVISGIMGLFGGGAAPSWKWPRAGSCVGTGRPWSGSRRPCGTAPRCAPIRKAASSPSRPSA